MVDERTTSCSGEQLSGKIGTVHLGLLRSDALPRILGVFLISRFAFRFAAPGGNGSGATGTDISDKPRHYMKTSNFADFM